MSLINEYRNIEESIKELQERLKNMSQDDKLKKELEFEGKLRTLMGEYQKSLRDIIALLDPEAKTGKGVRASKPVAAKRARKVALGRDCRLSSPRLHKALLEGILETGLHVLDLGVGPTPIMYFTVFHRDLDGGVHVTGSHNPAPENGFKAMSGEQTLSGEDIQSLRTLIERHDFVRAPGGKVEEIDPLPAYVGFVRGNVRLARTDLRVAIDAGSGAAGPLALASLGILSPMLGALWHNLGSAFVVGNSARFATFGRRVTGEALADAPRDAPVAQRAA